MSTHQENADVLESLSRHLRECVDAGMVSPEMPKVLREIAASLRSLASEGPIAVEELEGGLQYLCRRRSGQHLVCEWNGFRRQMFSVPGSYTYSPLDAVPLRKLTPPQP